MNALAFLPQLPGMQIAPICTTLQFDRQLYSMYLFRKQSDFITNVRRYSCNVSDFNRLTKLEFGREILVNIPCITVHNNPGGQWEPSRWVRQRVTQDLMCCTLIQELNEQDRERAVRIS
jgi:hypothetical protein